MNTQQPILALDGTPFADDAGPLTLKRVLCDALLASYDEDQGIHGTEKVRRAVLAQDIYRSDALTLRVEDAALCKELVARAWGPLVVQQAWAALDPP
jgi:hypothetical protein